MALIQPRFRQSALRCPLCHAGVAYDQALVRCRVCNANQHHECVHELGPCCAAPLAHAQGWFEWIRASDLRPALFTAIVLAACASLWVTGHPGFFAPAYFGAALVGAYAYGRPLLDGWRRERFAHPQLMEQITGAALMVVSAALSLFALVYLGL